MANHAGSAASAYPTPTEPAGREGGARLSLKVVQVKDL